MAARSKQQILKEACALLGRKVIADELQVSDELVHVWIRGDATMPDGYLLLLSEALIKLVGGKP
jgi:hypothetical protein